MGGNPKQSKSFLVCVKVPNEPRGVGLKIMASVLYLSLGFICKRR
jgi:hypothetical protein